MQPHSTAWPAPTHPCSPNTLPTTCEFPCSHQEKTMSFTYPKLLLKYELVLRLEHIILQVRCLKQHSWHLKLVCFRFLITEMHISQINTISLVLFCSSVIPLDSCRDIPRVLCMSSKGIIGCLQVQSVLGLCYFHCLK